MEQKGEDRETRDRQEYIPEGTETIFRVDDEEYLRELGVELFSDFGYIVLTATDWESALEVYAKELERIDLVILDLVIPRMGDKICYREILKINPRAKILVVSGYPAAEQGREALEAGAKGFVGVPFDLVHMLKTVRGILDQD